MESKEAVKLLGFWASPFSVRVEWALRLKGVEYEYIEEDIFNKSPMLLELNPVHKKVPVLIHGEKVILESLVILEYIDETWKQFPILPRDPYDRAMARFWAKFAEEKLLDNVWMAMCTQGEEKETYRKQAVESLEKIEQELIKGKSKFFGGESVGYLDIALGMISYWLPVWEEVGSMTITDPTRFPATAGWAGNFRSHPAVKDKLPPRDKIVVYFQWRSKEIGAQIASARKASSDPLLPQDLCQSAADLSSHSSVPYKPLLRLLSGSDFIFTCPKPREKSEELKARLWKLEELAERKKYEELVKDITQSKGTDEPFSSYKDQLGFAISSALFDYGQELWCQISMLVCLATFILFLTMKALIHIRDLQENNFTGQISDEIGNCVSLILLLGLSTNLLHGGIPFSISKLKQLELFGNQCVRLLITRLLFGPSEDEQFESDEAQVVVVKEIAALEPQAQVVKEIAALEPQARKKLRHLNPKPVHDLAFLYVQRRENGAHVHWRKGLVSTRRIRKALSFYLLSSVLSRYSYETLYAV
ncbi:hypothetical protein RHGRI_011994 [Rhododendron griersonianum]|uniref:Probable glutathione S-transferase n=1 Tax=Rhododendron griersonianum TaxID=479676 RepID=A0AAV6KNX6_9ERIC|nr:hypothetical protein RHGRI_011994 [Rhododendron griersonianum]